MLNLKKCPIKFKLQIRIRCLTYLMFSLHLLLIPAAMAGDRGVDNPVTNTQLESVLEKKLENYRQWYPDLQILRLGGGDQIVTDMMLLGETLGKKPVNMGYEHPDELRKDLINVSVNRILQMLQLQMPSSALFRTDKQQAVCVLAINPPSFASSPIHATSHLLDQPLQFIRKIPTDLLLSAEDYLEFVIDHEMFHCLQSMYIGPVPMSHKALWGEYHQFLNEQSADYYAVGMHIRKHGSATPFTRSLQLIRGASLASADANHFTSKGIQQVLKLPAREFTEADGRGVFAIAREYREKEFIDYKTYIQYIASAIEAMKILGLSELITEGLQVSQVEISPDPIEVRELVSHTRQSLAELTAEKNR